MGFKLEYYYNGYYPYFTMGGELTDKEFENFIAILQILIDMDKPFVFLVDTREISKFNFLNCGWGVVQWMKKNKPKIKKILKGSAVIVKNQLVSDVLNWIFEKQPPVSPNKITTDINEAKLFIENFIPPQIRETEETEETEKTEKLIT
jgi:hypothetical protein